MGGGRSERGGGARAARANQASGQRPAAGGEEGKRPTAAGTACPDGAGSNKPRKIAIVLVRALVPPRPNAHTPRRHTTKRPKPRTRRTQRAGRPVEATAACVGRASAGLRVWRQATVAMARRWVDGLRLGSWPLSSLGPEVAAKCGRWGLRGGRSLLPPVGTGARKEGLLLLLQRRARPERERDGAQRGRRHTRVWRAVELPDRTLVCGCGRLRRQRLAAALFVACRRGRALHFVRCELLNVTGVYGSVYSPACHGLALCWPEGRGASCTLLVEEHVVASGGGQGQGGEHRLTATPFPFSRAHRAFSACRAGPAHFGRRTTLLPSLHAHARPHHSPGAAWRTSQAAACACACACVSTSILACRRGAGHRAWRVAARFVHPWHQHICRCAGDVPVVITEECSDDLGWC